MVGHTTPTAGWNKPPKPKAEASKAKILTKKGAMGAFEDAGADNDDLKDTDSGEDRDLASGVGVNDQCLTEYQALKLKKAHKYVIFTLSKDFKEIVVEKTSSSQSYDDFVGDLPELECRWAVYDFEFEKEEGKRNKICFFSWSPDDAKIKQKMLFASSKDALRRSLVGIAVEIQGTDYSEVAFESVLDKAGRGF